MIANYHTHTPRCNHAQGSEQEYVDAALSAGLKILGFSDHTPYFFPGDYYSTFRMHPEELPGYVSTVKGLQARYAGRLEIHTGVEAEYYPKYFDRMVDFLRENQIEYMILGQHFVGNEPEGIYSGRETADKAVLETYVRQIITAMETGLFTYVAHPDILNYTGSAAIYNEWMGVLVEEAANCGVPLEFNFLGFREGRNYPNQSFLELVAGKGLPMVLGCDAHRPEALNVPKVEAQVREWLAKLGIPVLETVTLKTLG